MEWERWRRLLADRRLPAAVVDLDALDRNIERILAQMGDSSVTLRVASKSVRHPGLLRRILEAGGSRFRGVMCYAAGEAAFLADQGFDDLLIAYPIGCGADAADVARICAGGGRVWATVDDESQLPLLSEAAVEAGTEIPVCLDVDMSWRPARGALHLGVRRSPVRDAADAVRVARAAADTEGVVLTAVLAYEAQIAGMRDRNPTSRWMDPIRQLVKRGSRPVALARRRAVVEALRAEGVDLQVVNGGGTGSVAFTAQDPSVTEVAAGSGFLCPHLFDGYHGLALEPAALFALPVVRRSDADHVTCFGGGYVASGEAGPSRLPVVHMPPGLEPVDLEGFGEVQTPLRWRGAGEPPGVGDPVLCRHAKAGELAERFTTYLLVENGEVIAEEPTYRGMGACFG